MNKIVPGTLVEPLQDGIRIFLYDDLWKILDSVYIKGEVALVVEINVCPSRSSSYEKSSYVKIMSPRGIVGYSLLSWMKRV